MIEPTVLLQMRWRTAMWLILMAIAVVPACSLYPQESATFIQGGEAIQPGVTLPVLLSKDQLDKCPSTLVSPIAVAGTTQLQAVIDTQGKPIDVKITQSSGSKVHDDAAVTCLKGSTFKPGLVGGKLSQGHVDMTVKWNSLTPPERCAPTMPVAATLQVTVTPSPTESEPLPSAAQAIVCGCVHGADKSELVVLSSSGNARLDEGATKLMRSGMEKPGGGPGCTALRIEFHVRN